MTDPELRALAWKIAEGRVFGMWNVPQDLWLLVFMPLGWMKKRDLVKHKADTVYAIVGEDSVVPGRAINGFPMFASCHFLLRADFERVNRLVEEAQAKRKAFLDPASTYADIAAEEIAKLKTKVERVAKKTPRKKAR